MTAQTDHALRGILARLRENPESYEANVKLALFHQERGETDEALARLAKAEIQRPDEPDLLLLMGVLLRAVSRRNESGRYLARALALAPDDFDCLFQYGQHLFLEGDYAGAENHLRRALAVRPDDPEALNDRGVACYLLGRFEEAEESIRRALSVAPDNVQPRVNLGYVLLARKRPDEARAVAEALGEDAGPDAARLRHALDQGSVIPAGEEGTPPLGLSASIGRIKPMGIVKNFGEAAGDAAAPSLSIVVPILNEAQNIPILHRELGAALGELDAAPEIIFIDDGSTDGSAEVLEGLALEDPRVRVIRFRRNYGQTAALAAGFKYCRGEIVVTLDGDLQNDPADIPRLLDKMAEGYDLVSGWRKDRKDKTLTRKIPSWAANRLINKLIEGTGVQLNDFGCTLKAYKKGIVKNIHIYGEMHRFIPVFAAWLGVRVAEVEVNHRPRVHGQAKYNLSRVWRVIFDLIVVRFFSDYMTRPIQFFGKIARKATGAGLAGIAALWGLKEFAGLPVSYDALFILLALLLVSGLQVVILGLSGELLIRSYFEGQDKDHYVVERILGG